MASLKRIEQQLRERREALMKRLDQVTRDVRHSDEPLPSDFSEQATARENEEVMDALGTASRQELSQINRTLARIEEGEYGTCSECGQPIAPARLKVMPHTELCIRCAEKLSA